MSERWFCQRLGFGGALAGFWYGLDGGVGASRASVPQLGPRRRQVELVEFGYPPDRACEGLCPGEVVALTSGRLAVNDIARWPNLET